MANTRLYTPAICVKPTIAVISSTIFPFPVTVYFYIKNNFVGSAIMHQTLRKKLREDINSPSFKIIEKVHGWFLTQRYAITSHKKNFEKSQCNS